MINKISYYSEYWMTSVPVLSDCRIFIFFGFPIAFIDQEAAKQSVESLGEWLGRWVRDQAFGNLTVKLVLTGMDENLREPVMVGHDAWAPVIRTIASSGIRCEIIII